MRSAFTLLAARRLTGVGTALAVEAAILLALAQANSSAVVGIPAAVAAAIAGTVAVVFGPVDGVLVSLAGAAVFGLATSWKAGTLAALVVWPAIVFAVGLFARRVERGRTGLEQIVAAQELERQRLALELHDETAQTLVAALIALRHDEQQAGSAEQGSSAATSRALIEATIQAVRRLAVDLRPKVLDDFGLVPAVERLAETLSERTGISVDVDGRGWTARLPGEIELALYRTVQEALANSAGRDLHAVRIVLEQKTGKAAVAVETDGFGDGTDAGVGLEGLRERLRLLDGRLAVAPRGAGRTTLRAEVPIRAESSRVAVTRGRGRA